MCSWIHIIMLLAGTVSARSDANAISAAETKAMHDWSASCFSLPDANQPATEPSGKAHEPRWPFSFVFGDRAFSDQCGDWKFERTSRARDADSIEHRLIWRDPRTGLTVRCVAVVYRDFPTVEWTLYLKNEGAADSPMIQDVQALDASLERAGKGEFLLHHAVGSPANGSDYAPLETPLGPKAVKTITAAGGRPTNTDLCFFNLHRGGAGWIIAVGWPAQWAGQFTRTGGNTVHVRIGQEQTHFKLRPGEEVRSPLVAVEFWSSAQSTESPGDWIRAQNIWRRWMIAHNLPRLGGNSLPPPQFVASSSRAYAEMIHANEANQIMHIDRYIEEKLQLDYWWMDAGWYVNKTGWPNVGTWEVDTKRFPHGLKAVSDHARIKGIKTIVWFEPERVTPGTWLYENHPEWLLGPDGKQKLLNLGDDRARAWLTEHIDHLITEQDIGLYRQDFNIDPLSLWRTADAPDRQGITENKYVTGLLAYWDELRRRHPDMLIDCCASGGRRNDLETLRRAVPLWRSDYAFEPVGHQSMTYGISLWIPYHGTGTVACVNASYYGAGATPIEPYAFWSNAAPSLGCGIDIREPAKTGSQPGIDYDAFRKLVAAWRSTSECYYGDFYPLTACSRQSDVWIAWQFDRPDLDRGMVQIFRRADSPYESARLKLCGLDPEAQYTLADLTADHAQQISGRELADTGLLITVPQKPAAAVIAYRRLQ